MKPIQDCYIVLGEVIKLLRHKNGMRQEDLAKKMGMSRGSIANIEIGRQRPMIHDVIRFSKVLNTTPKKIFDSIL